ncbi:MAG: hypothetical protein ACKV2T_25445 [Kofleriaceae bacterium]
MAEDSEIVLGGCNFGADPESLRRIAEAVDQTSVGGKAMQLPFPGIEAPRFERFRRTSLECHQGSSDRRALAKPIAVKIGTAAWRKVRAGRTEGPFDLKVPAHGAAIAIDVQAPAGAKRFRRWAAIMPEARYRIVENACAIWGLEVDASSERSERVRIDATALPAGAFPLVIETGGSGDPDAGLPDKADDTVAFLDKPGVSDPLEMHVSAMCSRSGTSVTVWSKRTKKKLFEETLIPYPGALHTIELARAGSMFTLSVD